MKPLIHSLSYSFMMLFMSPHAQSAEFFQLPGTNTLYMMGEIQIEDTLVFQDFLDKYDIKELGLAGPGGSVDAALEIGRLVQHRGISTLTVPDRDCASACALVFLSGHQREISEGSRIGVHLPFIDFQQDGVTALTYCRSIEQPIKPNFDDQLSALRSGQGIGIFGSSNEVCLTSTYQLAFEDALNFLNLVDGAGVDQRVFRDMISTPPSQMKWYTTEEGSSLNLSTKSD